MAHFGLLVPPFFGHLRPMSVVGKALHARGHRVTILTFLDGVTPLATSQLEVAPFGQSRFPAGEWDRRAALMGAAEGRAIMRHSLDLIIDQGRSIVEDLP